MKIADDREADALYIRFVETTVTTKNLAEGIAADYDADGRLAGIEILDAVKRLGRSDRSQAGHPGRCGTGATCGCHVSTPVSSVRR